MGICNTTKNKNGIKAETSQNINAAKTDFAKRINPHSIIKFQQSSVVVKHINEINGDAIQIEGCKDSTIIIMDYSAQVIIEQCDNCNIFIAPCKSSVFIRNSKNISLISASQQFRCRDIEDSKFSIFSASSPAIEKTKNLKISCFCFRYTELFDLFIKADLNVWNNSWSEFIDFSDDKKNIQYFNVKSDLNFMGNFSKALHDQEISVDQYFPVPLTQGLSVKIPREFTHMLIFFKENEIDHQKTCDFFNEENLKETNSMLIKTSTANTNDNSIKEIESYLKNQKNNKFQFFQKLKVKFNF